jgi:hypothetical protein
MRQRKFVASPIVRAWTEHLKRICALAVLLVASIMYKAPAADNALAWSYRYVLATSTVDGQLVGVLAGIAGDSGLRDPAMCDLLAEVFWSLNARKIRAPQAATGIFRILSQSAEPARYRDVIKGSARLMDGNLPPAYLTRFLEAHRRSNSAQYVPGTIDLEALRHDFAKTALDTPPTVQQAKALADLATDASLDEMFAQAGKPALVVSREMRGNPIVDIDVRQLWLYYRGIGRMTYDFKRDSGWHQYAFIADPMAFETAMPYRGELQSGMPDDATIAMIQLLSGNASSIKASAQTAYRLADAPPEYLETAAEVLLQQHVGIANTGANDAYAWICNVLVHHGGPRYARVLETVEKQTPDPKLRRFAAQRIENRKGMNPAPYVAGSVSLTEQARKYPSLYPQIALIRGLL